MKVTLENEHGIYSVETKSEYQTLDHVMEYLIEPLFLSVGWSEGAIEKCFGGDE